MEESVKINKWGIALFIVVLVLLIIITVVLTRAEPTTLTNFTNCTAYGCQGV